MTPLQAIGQTKVFGRLAETQAFKVIPSPSLSALPAIPEAPRFGSILPEDDDAVLNGMTRSLQRRLFGLNVPAFRQAA